MTAALPRYAPGLAFPPYAFLPGRDPHPARDPRGHSYGRTEPKRSYMPPEEWPRNVAYLEGVDLYNHGYLWEAHEAWESQWHPSKEDAVQADFLQGLIQCAAACLKIPMEQPAGLARLAEMGTARLDRVVRSAGAHYMGLDVPDFVARVRAFVRSAPESIEERPLLLLDGASAVN